MTKRPWAPAKPKKLEPTQWVAINEEKFSLSGRCTGSRWCEERRGLASCRSCRRPFCIRHWKWTQCQVNKKGHQE
jgi:hypothetical protein